jgi:hypothetical protein
MWYRKVTSGQTHRIRWMWATVMLSLTLGALWAVHSLWNRGLRVRLARVEIAELHGEVVRMGNEGITAPLTLTDVIAHSRVSALADSAYCARMHGRDPWGNEYFVDSFVDDGSHGFTNETVVVVRSFGPNMRDDAGRGDDINAVRQYFRRAYKTPDGPSGTPDLPP